jgi:hypothetical protein
MKTILLSILGGMAATAGVGYVAVSREEAQIVSLRADNAAKASKLNAANAAIDAAIKVLQDARK